MMDTTDCRNAEILRAESGPRRSIDAVKIQLSYRYIASSGTKWNKPAGRTSLQSVEKFERQYGGTKDEDSLIKVF